MKQNKTIMCINKIQFSTKISHKGTLHVDASSPSISAAIDEGGQDYISKHFVSGINLLQL